jgi:hypothetical protein
VLGGPHCRLVDRLVVALDPNIINHNSTVIASDCEKCGIPRMEIETHNA